MEIEQFSPKTRGITTTKPSLKWGRYFSQNWQLYVMILPAILLLAIFSYYPMYGIVIAFQKYNPGLGFGASPWVGFKYFQQLFTNPSFYNIIRNTLLIALGKIISGQITAIILALLLNEVRHQFFKRSIQTIVYLPHFLSWIVLGGILLDILGTKGMINLALTQNGAAPIPFLTSNSVFIPTLILSELWKEVGWSAIIYLAALTGIDPQLYEAAAMDGANRLQQTWHISLPGISSVVIVLAALNLGNILNAGFDQVYTMLNSSVAETGTTLDIWVYQQGLISGNFSLAAATGLFSALIGFAMMALGFYLARRYADYHLF